jgi:acetyl-CoA carboxylase biotin carboxyl carrier protein
LTDRERDASTSRDRQTIARLAADTLPRLIERLARSDLGEIEVREDGWRIRLRRPNGDGLAEPASAVSASAATRLRSPAATSAPGRVHVPVKPDPPRGIVTSPAVGYFVSKDGVTVGFRVGRGDPIGFVDVLGVRQEVVAPADGVVGALEVEPGQAIEYGQPVARIEVEA